MRTVLVIVSLMVFAGCLASFPAVVVFPDPCKPQRSTIPGRPLQSRSRPSSPSRSIISVTSSAGEQPAVSSRKSVSSGAS